MSLEGVLSGEQSTVSKPPNLKWVETPCGEAFKRSSYELQERPLYAGDGLPPPDWRPSSDDRPLGKRAPLDWTEQYYTRHPGRFEPQTVFNNIVRLCNFAALEPQYRAGCFDIVAEFIELTIQNSRVEGDARFIVRNYEVMRRGYSLSPGWVNSLSNAWLLRGLCRYYQADPSVRVANLLDELARAFLVVNTSRKRLPRPWFSFIDDRGYLWFDEYPADDGMPTLVLNGHIHSLNGLIEYSRHRDGGPWVEDFIQGGLATMRKNAQRFRRPGQANQYSLRETGKPDYLPSRTVDQQRELADLTGDAWFSRMADTFEADHAIAAESIRRRQERKAARIAEATLRHGGARP